MRVLRLARFLSGSRLGRAATLGILAALTVSAAVAAASLHATALQEARPPGADYDGDAFTFHKVREGVYLAVPTGNLTAVGNASVVINDDDVLIVDSHTSPAGAWALLHELQRITAKPVRYVVNTHFHVDHVHGNQVYPKDVQIISHEFTREMIATGRSWSGHAYDQVVGSVPSQISKLERQLEATTDPGDRTDLLRQLRIRKNFLAATKAVVPTPPNVTLRDRMTLYRGRREIQLLFLGRGHTAGDVVVYLPKERVLMTGDLLLKTVPYMHDCYPLDWIATLERLKQLDFDVILGGHWEPLLERERIDHLQAYLRDLWSQASQMHNEGVAAEEAARRIDLRSHAAHYPNIKGLGVGLVPVQRIYELLDQQK